MQFKNYLTRVYVTSRVDTTRQCDTKTDSDILWHRSWSARAKRTLFMTKSARTLTNFIMRTHFTFF